MIKKVPDPQEIVFERRDSEIFRIPDARTRIETLQNYFFPRLEGLLRHTLELVQEIYEVNPYERITFVYHPSNRRDAKVPRFFPYVHIGISCRRQKDRPLVSKRPNGKPSQYYTTYLTYTVHPEGTIHVELRPFIYRVDKKFANAVTCLIRANKKKLISTLNLAHIAHSPTYDEYNGRVKLLGIEDAFTNASDQGCRSLFSPTYYFPVCAGRGLEQLVAAFVVLYPLFDAITRLEEGSSPQLEKMLTRLADRQVEQWKAPIAETTAPDENFEENIELPELDSYTMVRAGLWWDVLARDEWKCRSCGRSVKQEGIVLHVDHIRPRSKGGSNDIDNLQTLCSKCNIGKSNRDDTDLRSS